MKALGDRFLALFGIHTPLSPTPYSVIQSPLQSVRRFVPRLPGNGGEIQNGDGQKATCSCRSCIYILGLRNLVV